MSPLERIKWLERIQDDCRCKANCQAVAAVIAVMTNRHLGYCRPSKATIAERAGMSKRSVDLALSVLAKRGYIVVERTKGRACATYAPTMQLLHRSENANGASPALLNHAGPAPLEIQPCSRCTPTVQNLHSNRAAPAPEQGMNKVLDRGDEGEPRPAPLKIIKFDAGKQRIYEAIRAADTEGILAACGVADAESAEWVRETFNVPARQVGFILTWKLNQRAPIRFPSQFRAAMAEFQAESAATRATMAAAYDEKYPRMEQG
jgi:hypothetical protein